MTVNPSNTNEFTISQLIRNALHFAGLMPLEAAAEGLQWDARARFGREQLDIILKRVQTQNNMVLRHEEFYELTISEAGQGGESSPLTLPEDTIDVLGDAMFKRTGDTMESRVIQVDRETWHAAVDKTTQQQPTRFFVDRSREVKLYLLPPPSSNDLGTMRLRRQKLAADSTQGQYTPDAERYWADFLQWELAFRFAAGSLPEQARVARREALAALAAALEKAKPQTGGRVIYRHQTGWHGR